MNKRAHAIANGYKSGLEDDIAEMLSAYPGVSFTYESLVLNWEKPSSVHTYRPDFVIVTQSGKTIVVESKGRWVVADRKKMKLVVQQHPDLDIRMVFQNPRQKIAKKSETSYAEWCDKNLGIPWAAKTVPPEWLNE